MLRNVNPGVGRGQNGRAGLGPRGPVSTLGQGLVLTQTAFEGPLPVPDSPGRGICVEATPRLAVATLAAMGDGREPHLIDGEAN